MAWPRPHRLLRRFAPDQHDFTLAEVLVATGLLTTGLTLIVGALFQSLGAGQGWREDLGATLAWRQGISIFARDALNAQATDLPDPGPPQGSVTLSWTAADLTPHTAIYSLSGTDLIRDFDGVISVAARRVATTSFDLASDVLTFTLTVNASSGTTDTAVHDILLRRLP